MPKKQDALIEEARLAIDSQNDIAAKRVYLQMCDLSESIAADLNDEFSDVMCELAPLALSSL